jgi:hypothetical protein
VPVRPEELLDPVKRREWQEMKSMSCSPGFIQPVPYEEIDLFIHHPIDFEEAYQNKKELPVGTFSIPLASVSDLIAMKRHAHREQDRSDIMALEQLLRLREGEQS